MQEFTGNQWLLIALAGHYGLDKKLFEERLAWGRELLDYFRQATTIEELAVELEPWIAKADGPEEFAACALAIWDSINGRPSNYALGMDSCNSGAQITSCLGRCEIGMKNTGLINTGTRPDLYQLILDNVEGFETDRTTVKKATVPHLYGSKAEPKNVFGEEKYPDFIAACVKTMPVLEWAKDVLIACWDPTVLYHEFILPNGGFAHIKVINKTEYTGHFLNFNYNFFIEENKPKAFGEKGTTSLAAHVIHGFDGYILSELDARSNYDKCKLEYALNAIESHLAIGSITEVDELIILNQLTNKFNICSIVAVEHIQMDKLNGLDENYLLRVKALIESVLLTESFELKNIH